MRGERELSCLELIKEDMFTKNGIPIKHPITKKTYEEINDEEFKREQIWYINDECSKNFFGLLEEDRIEIEQSIRNARPNENLNNFPDFVFPGGFIEHFRVTSSKTTNKGAKHTKEMNHFENVVKIETEKIESEWNDIPSFDKVRSKQWEFDNPNHSHEYLIKSLELNWNNHIRSLEKYSGVKDIGIFMIEYPEFALSMFENVYAHWIDGMAQGDMREPEKFKCYRLSRDKKMLNFIYQYRNKIKYVIFVYRERYEIIQTQNIPYILQLIPWEYIIYPLVVKTVSSLYNISIPANIDDEGEKVNE